MGPRYRPAPVFLIEPIDSGNKFRQDLRRCLSISLSGMPHCLRYVLLLRWQLRSLDSRERVFLRAQHRLPIINEKLLLCSLGGHSSSLQGPYLHLRSCRSTWSLASVCSTQYVHIQHDPYAKPGCVTAVTNYDAARRRRSPECGATDALLEVRQEGRRHAGDPHPRPARNARAPPPLTWVLDSTYFTKW